jgi:hypothetical protein
MPQPTLPPELHDKILDMLEGYHDALKHISETSKAFIPRARPILFRNIRIRSFKHVVQLAELLESKLCTIPTTAQSLEVQFEFPVRGKKQEPYISDDVTFAMAHVYEHFLSFEVYIGINVPWIFGRRMDWTYLQPYTSLRKFSWTGEYTWLCEITEFLYYMPNLECLIADATFKDDRDPPTTVSLRRGNAPCRVSTTLKELALSPQCLPMMRWFCNLESGRPDSLHTFRIKADSIRHHAAYYYQDIVSFFQKYGKGLAHLYAWFDNCSSSDYDLLEGTFLLFVTAASNLPERYQTSIRRRVAAYPKLTTHGGAAGGLMGR